MKDLVIDGLTDGDEGCCRRAITGEWPTHNGLSEGRSSLARVCLMRSCSDVVHLSLRGTGRCWKADR